MKYWEHFSEAELREIIQSSKTYKEALTKLGYNNTSSSRNIVIKEIANKYNISLEHFRTGSVIDLTGQVFGNLTVLQRVSNKNQGFARWLCLCDCGNTTEVDGIHLTRHLIQSCGCLQKKKISSLNDMKLQDLTNQKFGALTVIQRLPNKGKQPCWLCQCDCGNLTEVLGGNLRKENGTRSCGCHQSKGELKIIKLLQDNNIAFRTQISFPDCVSPKGNKLRYDFGIYNTNYTQLLYLIEFQGIQHYQETFWSHDDFEERNIRDNIKIEYCRQNHIPLIIIPYTMLDSLTIEDLLLNNLKEDLIKNERQNFNSH